MSTYIDPGAPGGGSGSILSPFNSWSSVAWVAGGYYLQKAATVASEAVTVGASGTLGNVITLSTYGGTGYAIIDATGQSYGIAISPRDYITVDGFEVKNANGHGIQMGGAASNNQIVQNCYCHDNNATNGNHSGIGFITDGSFSNHAIIDCISNSNANFGIGCSVAVNGATISNISISGTTCDSNAYNGCVFRIQYDTTAHYTSRFSGITVTNCSFTNNGCYGFSGLYSQAGAAESATKDDLTVISSKANDNGIGGWHLYGLANSSISSIEGSGNGTEAGTINYSYGATGTNNVTKSPYFGGVWLASSDYITISNSRFVGNMTTLAESPGVYLDQWSTYVTVKGCYFADGVNVNTFDSGAGMLLNNTAYAEIYGNVFANNYQGIAMESIEGQAHNSTGNHIYNNTFYGNTRSGISFLQNATDGDHIIRNNIIMGGQYAFHRYAGADPPPGDTTQDENYNCVYGQSVAIGNNFTSVAANSITTDPLFVDPTNGNFSLSLGSPCRKAGIYVDVTDYYGAPLRSIPDIGAVQYVGGRGLARPRLATPSSATLSAAKPRLAATRAA